jgi:hypothetical protein
LDEDHGKEIHWTSQLHPICFAASRDVPLVLSVCMDNIHMACSSSTPLHLPNVGSDAFVYKLYDFLSGWH